MTNTPTTSYYVLSHRSISSEHPEEYGSGGFTWLPHPDTTLADALIAFNREVDAWEGGDARVRLVQMGVPAHLTGDDVTNYLDEPENLDRVEVEALPIAERRVFSGNMSTLTAAQTRI